MNNNEEFVSKCDCGEECYNLLCLHEHKKTNCRNRYLSCVLCNKSVASCDMSYHLIQCGSKTRQCPNCKRYICQANYTYHIDNQCIDLDEDNSFPKDHFISDRNNDIQTNDDNDEFIPCEFCNEQIKFTSYDSHTKNCFPKRTPHRQHFTMPTSIIDHSSYEQNVDETPIINPSTADKTSRGTTVTLQLQNKTKDVRESLINDYYEIEIDHATNKLQFNILLIGAPRVGKSQLINALCNEENLAKTSSSLNSCTKTVECYVLEDNQQQTPGVNPFRINFYDTPGIESWTNEGGTTTMLKFIEEKDPICLMYCAAPGTFADLKQLRVVLEFCKERKIFCALVCTNMWANQQRHIVIEEFKNELMFFGDEEEKQFKQEHDQSFHKVIHFGNGALCTMVNSKEYYDPDISPIRKPVQGIDELIHCIMDKLDNEKLLGWCYAVLYRRSFWEKLTHKINGFRFERLPNCSNMTASQAAIDFVSRLFSSFENRKK